MNYECYRRFKDHKFKIGDVIGEQVYNALTAKEKRKFREHHGTFFEEFENNRIEDSKKENED